MDDKGRKFYDALVSEGKKLPDYDIFMSTLQDREKSSKFYDALKKEGKKLPDFEKFYSTFTQEPTKQTPTQQETPTDQPLEQVPTQEEEQPTKTIQQEPLRTGVRTGQFGNVGLSTPKEDATEQPIGENINPVLSYLNIFSSRIANVPSDLGETWAVASAFVERQLGKLGVPGANKDLKATDIWSSKLASDWRDFTEEVYPVREGDRETFGGQIVDGLGQVASIALTGGKSASKDLVKAAIQNGSRLTPYINAAKEIVGRFGTPQGVIAGSQITAPMYKEAIESGATEDEALQYALENFFVGSVFETLPVQSMFSRLKKLEPNSSVLNILKEGVTGFGEEAVTEMWQEMYGNMSALRIYDVNRELLDGVGEAGAVGGSVGFILNSMLAALTGKRARVNPSEQKQIDKSISEVEAKLKKVEDNNNRLEETVDELTNTTVRKLSDGENEFQFVVSPNGNVELGKDGLTKEQAEKVANNLNGVYSKMNFEIKDNTDQTDPLASPNFTVTGRPKVSPKYTQGDKSVDKKTIEETIENAETIEDLEGLGIENDSELESKLSDKFKEISDKSKSELKKLDATTEQEQPSEQQPTAEESVVVEDVREEPTDKGTDIEVQVDQSEDLAIALEDEAEMQAEMLEERDPYETTSLKKEKDPTDIFVARLMDDGSVLEGYIESNSPSEIKGYNDFFYDKTGDGYNIYDKKTGFKITEGKTKKDALDKFKTVLEKNGGVEGIKYIAEKTIKERKAKQDAIQEQSPTSVPERQKTKDSEGVQQEDDQAAVQEVAKEEVKKKTVKKPRKPKQVIQEQKQIDDSVSNPDLQKDLDGTFESIAKKSKSPIEFIEKAKKVKNVPASISKYFMDKYGKQTAGDPTPMSAAIAYLAEKNPSMLKAWEHKYQSEKTRQEKLNDEYAKKSKLSKEYSRKATEKLNKEFEDTAYEGLNEEEKFQAIIEDKLAFQQELTQEEVDWANENTFLPKGFQYDKTGSLIESKQEGVNPPTEKSTVTKETSVSEVSRDTGIETESKSVRTEKSDVTVNDSRPRVTFEFLGEELTGTKDGEIIIGDDGTKYREGNISNLKEIPDKDRLSKQKEAVKKAFDEVKKTFNEGNKQGVIYDFEKAAKDDIRFYNALRNLVVEYARLKGMQFDQAINELSEIFKRPITKKNKDYIKTIWDEVTVKKPTTKQAIKQSTEGRPSTKKDTLINEYQELKRSLKEQVKAAKEGFRQGKKEATDKAKEKADKITAIRNVITKFVNDDLADIKIDKLTRGEVKRIVSALNTVKTETSMNRAIDKIFDLIAKSANSSRVNKAKANQKTARKNVKAGKIGLTEHNGAIDTLLKIDPNIVPRDVFERFEAIIDNLSKRISVLKPREKNSLIDEANEILKKVEEQNTKVDELRQAYENAEKVKGVKTVDGEKVKYDSYSKTVDKMLKDGIINEDDARLMRDRRNDIIEKETEVSEEVDVEAAKKELIDEILNENNSLPERNPLFNSDESKILNFFNSLTKADLENLSLADLKRISGLKENLRNNYVPHLAEKYRAKIEGIRASKPLLPILGNFKGGVLNLWNFISGTKAKIKNRFKRGSTSTMQEKIRRNPTLYIDQVIGNFKSTVLYDNTFRKLSEGHSGYSFLIEKLKSKLSVAERKLKNPFESRAKISFIRLQEQFDSNDGQHSAKEWFEATLKDKNSIYDAEAKEELKRIFDKYTNKDGEFDVKKAKDSLSLEERNAYNALKEHFDALRDKADFTATTIRGNRVPMFENYHPVYRAVLGSDKSMELDKLQAMSKPSTKAGSLTDRTGSVHAISFDPFDVAMFNAREVLLDYYMTPVMNEVNSTMDALERAAETEQQSNAVTALRRVIEEVTENVIGVNFGSSNIADAIINELTRKGYQATLSGVGRSAAELTSNTVFAAVYTPTEFKNGAKILWNNRGDLATIAGVIENVPTTQKNRLLDYGGMDSKHIDYSRSGNEMRTVLSPDSTTRDVLNKAGNYYRAVDRWAANIVSKPDQMIAKPIWFGGFEQEFTNITGKKPNLKKIAENIQDYLHENRDAIEQSTKYADSLLTEAVSSQNPFDSVPKNQIRPSRNWIANFYRSFNSYMSNFRIFEHNSAVRGIASLVTNGVLTKEQGAKLLAAVSARIATYSLISSTLVPMSFKAVASLLGYEPEEEENKNEVGNILAKEAFSTIAMLAVSRNIGNWGNIPLNFGVEYLNKKYGEEITYSDKYDPYEDNLVFPLVPLERQGYGKDIATTAALNTLGPYSPIAKTLYNGATYFQRVVDAKTEETRIKNKDKLYYKTTFEIAGNLGLIPNYRDFRGVVNTILYETKQKAIEASKNNEDTDELDFDFDIPSFEEENINLDEIDFDNLDL